VSRSQPDDYAERLGAFGLGHEDLRAWQATGLPGEAFDGWLTGPLARRPTGARARRVYGAGDVHDFARRAIPGALASSQATGSWRSATAADCCSATR
jgi:hypothetical protein